MSKKIPIKISIAKSGQFENLAGFCGICKKITHGNDLAGSMEDAQGRRMLICGGCLEADIEKHYGSMENFFKAIDDE